MDQSIAQQQIEDKARRANAADLWDHLWSNEETYAWREEALSRVYARVVRLINSMVPLGPHGVSVADIGGGRGVLAKRIVDECALVGQDDKNMVVVDHSEAALAVAKSEGLDWCRLDLENEVLPVVFMNQLSPDVYVSTETMEHLSTRARTSAFAAMAQSASSALISVPNDRLGPDEEPQHTIMYNAMSLKRELRQYFNYVRIEVMGPFLLAVCGKLAEKKFSLSVTLPVRDEGKDLEPTLASFRGVADQLVVGIDPRTKDDTWEVASKYADEVFYIDRPQGPPEGHTKENCEACANEGNCPVCLTDKCSCIYPGTIVPVCKLYMGEDGVNFAHCRNQCLDKCEGDWIFMTEGHERLVEGEDVLLSLDVVLPKKARVGFVMRQGNGQQWAFPWLCRNASDIRYTRPVHNVLDYPAGTFAVMLPQIRTLHDRHHERGESRAKQRKAQNRSALLDDWLARKSEASLFYLGQEWRDIDPEKAIDRLEQFLQVSNNGVQRYQARLILAKEYMRQGKRKRAKEVVHGCTADDWSRTEHFVWLGDICFLEEDYEQAHRFYTYAATSIGQPPFTVWWIDLIYYGHLPAMRLAQTCGELGRIEEALMWTQKVVELLPHDAPPESFEEARANCKLLEDAATEAKRL